MKLKWLFAALVLLNLGLLMWGSWYKETSVPENRSARAPIAPEKMRLLNEPGVKLQPRKTAANAGLNANLAPACFHIGPFPDSALTAIAESKLNEWHLVFSRRAGEIKIVTGYQVYLPPLASKEAAERKRQELTRLGFKDHALVQDQAGQDVISVGLFSVEANAQNRVHELTDKGVEAKVQPLYQPRTVYWLDINNPTPLEIASQIKQTDWGAKDTHAQEAACGTAPNSGSAPPPISAPSDSVNNAPR